MGFGVIFAARFDNVQQSGPGRVGHFKSIPLDQDRGRRSFSGADGLRSLSTAMTPIVSSRPSYAKPRAL
jgi:hypothetical protein